MTTLAELRERHKNKIEEENNKGSQGGSGGDFANFKDGDNWVRILPGKDDPLDFFAESAIHKITGPDGKTSNYQCRKVHGEECPLCELYFDLWKRHKALNLKKGERSKFGNLATSIKPKKRFYAKVVVRALQEAKEDPVKYVAMSERLFDRVFAAVVNPDLTDEDDPDNTTILSLEKGNDFNIRITKQGDFNSFDESAPRIKKTRAGNPQEVLAWVDSPLNPKSLVKIGDYDEGVKIAQNLESTLNTVKNETATPSKAVTSEEDNDAKFQKGLKV